MNIDTETPFIELKTETEGIYGNLTGKPSINGTVINGNKSGTDYGLAEKSYIDSQDEANLLLAKDYTDLSVTGLASENYADQADAVTLLNAKAYTDALLTDKQDKLVAGANINISGRVISATGGGGGDVWELINEITVPADNPVGSVSITLDKNGNAFNLKKMWLIFNTINTTSTSESYTSSYIHFARSDWYQNKIMWQFRQRYKILTSANKNNYNLYCDLLDDKIRLLKFTNSTEKGVDNDSSFDNGVLLEDEMSAIGITLGSNIYAGTFTLYGVRK